MHLQIQKKAMLWKLDVSREELIVAFLYIYSPCCSFCALHKSLLTHFHLKSLFCHLRALLSMTSLLAHTDAQRTKWRFLPKNLNQLVIFVIELAFTWSRIDKNRAQFQKTNYFKKMKLSQNGFIISFCTNLIIKTETKIKIYKTDKTDFWHKNWLWISNFGDFC